MSQDSRALTPLQKGMLFQYLRAPHDGIYIMQSVCTLREDIDADRMRAAWTAVFHRFSALRLALHMKGGAEPSQSVRDSVTVPFGVHDWRSKGSHQQESDLTEFIASDLRHGFDV